MRHNTKQKSILFYNAIPMPHSIKMHNLLYESGFLVNFCYYKDLTALYPWKSLDSNNEYLVFGKDSNNLKKLLKHAWNADLVIITGWHNRIHIILSIFCYLFKIRYAYWLDVPEKPIWSLKTYIKKLLLKAADFLLITGIEGGSRISKWFEVERNKIRDFPYLSCNIDEMNGLKAKEVRMKKLNEGDKIKVLVCNRFEERKGYKNFYDALLSLDKNVLEEFTFLIIGSGSLYDKYKELFQELKIDLNIEFWVEYEKYLEYMRQTDILIHASLHEPFGIPPIDAMAYGKLVIASNSVMSTYDRIINGENGFLYEAGDSEELAKILANISKNKGLIYEFGTKAKVTSEIYSFSYNLDVIKNIIK